MDSLHSQPGILAGFKKLSRVRCVMILLVLAIGLSGAEKVAASDEVSLELTDETEFGSGASTSDDLYYPGGVPGVGLFVGNPNTSLRNDRVLVKYDLASLLLLAKKIDRAEIRLKLDFYRSNEASLELEVGYFPDPVEQLTGPELNRSDVEPAGSVEVTAEDASNQDGGPNSTEKVVDVTKAVNDALTKGLTSCVFRLSLPKVESRRDNTVEGIVITRTKDARPVLQVKLKD